MTFRGMIKLNGTWIPTPATLTFNVEDIDSEAFRTQDGVTHRKRIGKVIKLNCKWDIIPDTEQYYEFFNLLDNLPEFFPVQFPHRDLLSKNPSKTEWIAPHTKPDSRSADYNRRGSRSSQRHIL